MLVVLVLVSPADAIWQSYKNTRYLNIFIISGVYVLTAVVAMSILASRIYTNHSVLSSIPKTYIPIEHEDVRKHVRQMVQKVLERNAVVAYNVRPKYLALEVEGDAPGLTSRLSSVSAASPNPERLRACREWAKISHPGWSSPYSPDIPNLQYDVVVEELSSLIEAKAVSLSPADPLHAKSPRLSSPDPFGGHSTDNETAPPDPRIVQFLERPDNMSLRDYVSHLSSLNLINPPALSEQFLELYEYARFSGDPLTEDEFRRLMSIFAEILRGMTHLDEDLTSQIRELAPFEDSPDVYEGYETPTPASLHSSNVDDNHSTLSQTTGSSAQTTRRYKFEDAPDDTMSDSSKSLRTAPMSQRRASSYAPSMSTTRPAMTPRLVSGSSLRPMRSNISTASQSSARSGGSVIRLARANDEPLNLPYVISVDR